MASFGIRLSSKGKTLGTSLFLITSQIEWYKLHNHSTYTVWKLWHFVYRYIKQPNNRPMRFQCTFLYNHMRILGLN